MHNTISFALNKKREPQDRLTVITIDFVKALEPWENSYWLLTVQRVDDTAEPIMARVSASKEEIIEWIVLIGIGIMGAGSGLDIISPLDCSVIVKGFEAFLARKKEEDEYNS